MKAHTQLAVTQLPMQLPRHLACRVCVCVHLPQVVAIHSQGVPQEAPGGKIVLRNHGLANMSDLEQGKLSENEVVWEANKGVRISTIVEAVRNTADR